jgi:hypothetical protein
MENKTKKFIYDEFGIQTADFYNIDLVNDNFKFIDPYYVATLSHPVAKKANETVVDFFDTVRQALLSGNYNLAKSLFCDKLSEPKETCLGMASHGVAGKGLKELAEYALQTIYSDETKLTTVITRLEDIKLFVPKIAHDRVSDIFTNVIRKVLIEYTNEQCKIYGQKVYGMQSKHFWDTNTHTWQTEYIEQFIWSGDNKPKLLVPKCFISKSEYNVSSLMNLSIIPYLIEQELKKGESSLIQVRKDGTRIITKKAMRADLKRKSILLNKNYAIEFAKQKGRVVVDDFRKALAELEIKRQSRKK